MSTPRHLLLFDIDGTLLYTGGAGRIAFERAFETLFGVQKAWGPTRADGKTDPILIQEVACRTLGRELTLSEQQEIAKLYQCYFEEEIEQSERFRLLPGVPEILEALSRDARFLLGLATGNFKTTAYLKLKKGRLDRHFSFGGFGCDSKERFQLVAKAMERANHIAQKTFLPARVTVIGDTVQDILSGKKHATRTLGVLTGKTRKEAFIEAGADWVLEDFSDPKQLMALYE